MVPTNSRPWPNDPANRPRLPGAAGGTAQRSSWVPTAAPAKEEAAEPR